MFERPAAQAAKEWQGWLLPHGGSYSGRLPLWEKIACSTAAVVYPLSQTRSPQPIQVTLIESLSLRLWSVLREAFPERLLSVPEGCRDGLPFELVVTRRKPYRGVRARCNLGDVLSLIQPGEDQVIRSWSDWAESQVSAGRAIAPVFRLGLLLLDLSLDSPHESASPGDAPGDQ